MLQLTPEVTPELFHFVVFFTLCSSIVIIAVVYNMLIIKVIMIRVGKQKSTYKRKCFKMRAENGTQTRDPQLGRLVLYRLSYFRK